MEALPRLNVMFTVDSPGHRGPQPILIIPRVAAGGRAMARPWISDLRTRRRRPLSSRRCDPDASLGRLSGRPHLNGNVWRFWNTPPRFGFRF